MTNAERAALEQELAELEELEGLENVERLRASGAETMKGYSPLEQALIGAGGSMRQMQLGIKDLIPQLFDSLTQEEKDELEILAGGLDESGYATAGGIGADIAGMALPVGGIGQLLTKIMTKAPAILAKASPLLADLTGSALYEFSKAPVEGASREDRAKDSVIGGLVGAAGFSGLKKILNGVKPSKAAEEMLKENPQIRLTPQQMSDSIITRESEQALGMIPFASQKVANMQNQGLEDWNRVMLNKVNPSKDSPISEIGAGGFKQLQDNFSNEYSRLWGQITPENIDFTEMNKAYQSAMKSAAKDLGDEANPVKKVIQDAAILTNNFYKTGDVAFLEKADDLLRDAPVIAKSSKNLLSDYRKAIKSTLPNNVGKQLSKVDKDYSDYIVLQDSTSGTIDAVSNDIISPRNLIGAVKKGGNGRQLSRGEARLQKDAEQAADVFSMTRPDQNKLRQGLGLAATLTSAAINPVTPAVVVGGGTALATEPARQLITKGVGGVGRDALVEGAGLIGNVGRAVGADTEQALSPKIQEMIDKAAGFAKQKIDPVGDKQRALANILRRTTDPRVTGRVGQTLKEGLSVEELNSLIRSGSASYGSQDEY